MIAIPQHGAAHQTAFHRVSRQQRMRVRSRVSAHPHRHLATAVPPPPPSHAHDLQAVIMASKKRFTIEQQADPIEFWSWLLNSLHFDLTGGKPRKRSVVTGACILAQTGPARLALLRACAYQRGPSCPLPCLR